MRASSLVTLFGLALACSTSSRSPEPEPTEQTSNKEPSFDQMRPHVGDPAPAISLTTLAGSQVSLPMSKADRAAILIFGSFS